MSRVIFYTEAGEGIGAGHVSRCLVLAKELRSRGLACVFQGNSCVAEYVMKDGFATIINRALTQADVYVADLRGGIPIDLALRIQDKCNVFVILDDCAELPDLARFEADLVIYPGITDRPTKHLNWDGFCGEWFEGADWILLGEKFRDVPPKPYYGNRVVVCGGGSDSLNITTRALWFLKSINYSVRAIIGPFNNHFDETMFNDWVDIVRAPPDMAEALSWGDIAVLSYGNTVFECLALGIPVLTVPIFGDHGTSIALATQASGGTILGLSEDFGADELTNALSVLFSGGEELMHKGRGYVDGYGAVRIADKILEVADGIVG